jgi:hypothetical protein
VQLYAGVKVAVLILAFLGTMAMRRHRRTSGTPGSFVDDLVWGSSATIAVGITILLSHLLVYSPEQIYNEQRATIRALETNVLVLEAARQPRKPAGRNTTNE